MVEIPNNLEKMVKEKLQAVVNTAPDTHKAKLTEVTDLVLKMAGAEELTQKDIDRMK